MSSKKKKKPISNGVTRNKSYSKDKITNRDIITSLYQNLAENGYENVFCYYIEAINYKQLFNTYANEPYEESFKVFIPREAQAISCTITITPLESTFNIVMSFNIPKSITNSITIECAIGLYSNQKKYFLMKIKDKLKLKRKEMAIKTYDSICDMRSPSSEHLLSPFILRLVLSPQNASLNKSSEYIGLINEGNTCYMNAVLQTIFNLPIIRNQILTMDSSNCALIALKDIMFHLLSKGSNLYTASVKTIDLFKALKWEKSFWNSQQDAEEIFSLIYNYLAAIENKISINKDKESEGNSNQVIMSNFQGELITKIKCDNIDYASVTKETFLFLQLNITNASSLTDCIKNHFSIEELKGDNQYQKSNNQFYDAKKETKITINPNILCLQLKRFLCVNEAKSKQQKVIKNCQCISYSNVLDLTDYMDKGSSSQLNNKIKDKDEYVYSLFGIIIHDGKIDEGHYYAFINDFNQDKWFFFDDSDVSYANSNEVFDANFGGEDWAIGIEHDHISKITKDKERTAYILIYIKNNQINTIFNEDKSDGILKSIKDESRLGNNTNSKMNIDHYDSDTSDKKISSTIRNQTKTESRDNNNNNDDDDDIDQIIFERFSKMKKMDKTSSSTLSLDQIVEFEENIREQIISKKQDYPSQRQNGINTKLFFIPPSSSSSSMKKQIEPHQINHQTHHSSKKTQQINSKPKSTTQTTMHKLPLVTPNKSRLIFYYIDNKTSTIITKSNIQYIAESKMNIMKLIIDCYLNLPIDMKERIDMNHIKLIALNAIGIVIEILNDNDNVGNLLTQYANNQLYLCFYLFDFDFIYDLKQSHQLISFNFFKQRFYELNTKPPAFDEIRYPYISCITKDNKTIQSEKSISKYLIGIAELFGLTINNDEDNTTNPDECHLKIIDNCSSSIRQINNSKMIKVTELNDIKERELLRLIKAQLKDTNAKEIIRIVIESSKYN